jgi:hypothetical protein
VGPMFWGGGATAVLFRQTPIASVALFLISVALFPMLHHKDSNNIDNFPTDLNNRGGGASMAPWPRRHCINHMLSLENQHFRENIYMIIYICEWNCKVL